MDLRNSYFSIPGPVMLLGQWLNPYRPLRLETQGIAPLRVEITRRGKRSLQRRRSPLLIEMQLYLSCMVKKRVIFHEEEPTLKFLQLSELLSINFRTVVSTACDPVEFANHYPVKEEARSKAIKKLSPSILRLDCRQGLWTGDFEI